MKYLVKYNDEVFCVCNTREHAEFILNAIGWWDSESGLPSDLDFNNFYIDEIP